MAAVYSTYEAKSRFSEILRKVRTGQTVLVTYHGKTVAQIGPVQETRNLEERLELLSAQGVVSGRTEVTEATEARLRPVARRSGALERFLESRDQ